MNWNIYEHEKMKAVKEQHPEWIWNRGDTHIILGVPGSLEAFKTPVEPGNSFSPGPGTYGVSSWVSVDQELHAPENKMLEEMKWGFEEGYIPLVHSEWNAGDITVRSELFPEQEGQLYKNYFSVTLKNECCTKKEVKFYLVIRSFGASGGPISRLKGDKERIWINGAPMVLAGKPADGFGAVSYEASGKDIGDYIKQGEIPRQDAAVDSSTWASGAMEYKVTMNAGETATFDFAFQLHQDHWLNGWMQDLKLPLLLSEKREAYIEKWKGLLSIRMNLPDRRFQEALQCQLAHLFMFTVDNSIRITPISYPVWWLRDGAYVLNALNKGGFHEFSERACREIAHRDAFGGFGSEGDGPSDGIWVLSEHYLLTRDKVFLEDMYPHIERRADLIMQMRRTKQPMRKFTEFVIPKCMLDPNIDLMCLPAENGLIMGRMDHGIRVFWVNGFAYMALERAAFCARELGICDTKYKEEAREIKMAMKAWASVHFGKDDRDVNSAFWPAGWAKRDDELIRSRFQEFWERVRCPQGIHKPEREWTYFEAGQAHNFMLLGEREKAWLSIEWFLSHHTAPGLYTYPEAIDGNTALLWPKTRGWDDTEYVTPHGWTAAEVFHLLRDALVREEENTIIIGSGIPKHWGDTSFEIANMPTYYGRVAFQYRADKSRLIVELEKDSKANVIHELPFGKEIEVIILRGGTDVADYATL